MTDDAAVAELRAIRDLLIMTGGEEMDELTEGLSDKHHDFLAALETGEWTSSGDVTPGVAEALDISKRAVTRGKDDLLEQGYIEQRGNRKATEYRKTGLGLVAERAYEL